MESTAYFRLFVVSKRGKSRSDPARHAVFNNLAIYAEFNWVGYWDADFSTPLSEVDGMLRYWELNQSKAVAIWGSRVMRLGSSIERHFWRHVFGRLFATLVGLSLPSVKVYDSQCGAKVFKRSLIPALFEKAFVSPWIFDVELLYRLKNQPLLEYPLREWHDQQGGQFRLLKHGPRALWDLIKIRKGY